jgi:RNA polymerase sigma-70 factor (ECF subfamily)
MESKLLLLASTNFEALNSTIQREIYQEFYKLVYTPVFYMVKDHASTEDIIQLSFLKVVNHMPAIETAEAAD